MSLLKGFSGSKLKTLMILAPFSSLPESEADLIGMPFDFSTIVPAISPLQRQCSWFHVEKVSHDAV